MSQLQKNKTFSEGTLEKLQSTKKLKVRDHSVRRNARSRMLDALRTRMQSLYSENPETDWVFECDNKSIDVKTHRERLYNKTGVVVVLNAVTREEMKTIKPHIGDSMVQMYGDTWPEHVKASVRGGDLYAANPYRNSASGCGNASFAYLYKQFTAPEDAFEIAFQGDGANNECVKISHLPVHHQVHMRLMCENAPRRTELLLALSGTPERTMISWDSTKVAGGPPDKKMTKQVRTTEHIDEYGAHHDQKTNRLQAIINDDLDSTKLCFVPFTQDSEVRRLIATLLDNPAFFKQNGFKRLSGPKSEDVIAVLDEFAVAPPPLAMVAWVSGVVHYEAVTRPPRLNVGEVLFRFQSRQNRPKDRRLRFVIGTHTPTMSLDTCKRLAVVAMRGGVPEYNLYANRECAPTIYENIMNGKTTQFLKPRSVSQYERTVMNHAISEEDVDEDWNLLTPLYKHCYGVPQDVTTLGFGK